MGVIVNKQRVISAIEHETLAHFSKYMYFMEHFSVGRLISEMDAYLYHKQYDSSFGDIVPYILANALAINIVIVSQTDHNYDVIAIRSDDKCFNEDFIIVFKCGMHYDAMTIMHGISSAGICSGKGDHTFTCDSNNLQHVYISNISNCYTEARISDNKNNNPGTVSWKVKKTRAEQSELPNINPRNDLLYPLESIRIFMDCPRINLLTTYWVLCLKGTSS